MLFLGHFHTLHAVLCYSMLSVSNYTRNKLLCNILVHFTPKLGLVEPGNFALPEMLYGVLRNVEKERIWHIWTINSYKRCSFLLKSSNFIVRLCHFHAITVMLCGDIKIANFEVSWYFSGCMQYIHWEYIECLLEMQY